MIARQPDAPEWQRRRRPGRRAVEVDDAGADAGVECLVQAHVVREQGGAQDYNDGTRFLRDIEVKRKELGIPDQMLIRSR